jgi:hypothetical protein
MKSKLKPPGTKRLNVEYDVLLSKFGFKFNLRRYNGVQAHGERPRARHQAGARPHLTGVRQALRRWRKNINNAHHVCVSALVIKL